MVFESKRGTAIPYEHLNDTAFSTSNVELFNCFIELALWVLFVIFDR